MNGNELLIRCIMMLSIQNMFWLFFSVLEVAG